MRFVMSVVIHLTSFTSESSGRGKEEDSRDRKRERERETPRGRKLLKVKTSTINSSVHSSSYVSRGFKIEKSCVCVCDLKGKRAFVC